MGERNTLDIEDEFYRGIYTLRNEVYDFKTYVCGEWVESSQWLPVKTPINNEVIGRVPKLGWDVINRALQIIHDVGRWKVRDLPGSERLELMGRIAELMEEHKEALIEALVINAGKTYAQAEGEVNASIDRLRRAELDARKIFGEYVPGDWDETTWETEAVVRKEPFGVALAVIPFNYPLFDTVSKVVYSMIPGNAVVVKPPSSDPLPVLMFGKIAEEAGIPKEAFAIFTVPGRESDKLVSDRRIHAITLTGSTETGIHVLSVAGIKQFVMELGGGDPAIVLRDADLETAAERIALGIYNYAGQRCDAVKLILVDEPIYEDFRERIVKKLSGLKVGDPRKPETQVGPLINGKAVDNMIEAVNEAVGKGGKLLVGGRRLGETYVEPALIEVMDKEVLKGLTLYKGEVFAPVAIITDFGSDEEAIELVNGRDYGLDASIFGEDITRVRKFLRYLEVGAIYINDIPKHGVGYYPFGGRKASGIGREGIGYSVEHMTALKTIVYNYKGKGVWKYLK